MPFPCFVTMMARERLLMYYDPIETGKRVQLLRKARGLTQERLAEELNISVIHLAKIENGKRGCSLDILIDIATFFDASLDYLALGKARENELRGQLDCAIHALEVLRNSL